MRRESRRQYQKTDLNALYAIVKGKKAKYPVALPLTSANAWANYNTNGASANTIDINDFWQCYYVARGMLPKKYTAVSRTDRNAR